MKHILFLTALLLAPLAALHAAEATLVKPRAADFANVRYGPHERNVLDLWLGKAESPAPLVVFIHGGSFNRGDKSDLSPAFLAACQAEGWAVATINYRFTDTAPAPAAYLDGARAIQFLRSKAGEWKLDPARVAATGASAGAGISLWLGFHDDLADPASDDPVARHSTRLACVATDGGQCSYDPRFLASFGIPRPNLELHEFFLPFYGLAPDEIDTPRAHRLYEEMAPITYLTKDDPPVLMEYGFPNINADPRTKIGLVAHHPRFGITLKQRMDAMGIPCIVQHQATPADKRIVRHGGGKPVDRIGFLREHLEK
ncbi:MAG: alpha/beta hydrolase [Kiritimatiellales bacterium]|nr:alpha/beta hydrolase [Kiritimatiellales bacterium]